MRGLALPTLIAAQVSQGAGADIKAQVFEAIEEYSRGLQLARQQQVAAASEHFKTVDELVSHYPPPAQDFISIFRLSAWAYVHYKNAQWESALAELTRVLHLSAALEQQGYYTLCSRRLDTILNMVRVYYKQGCQPAGDALLRQGLRFWHSGQAQDLVIPEWPTALFQRIPALREANFQTLVIAVTQRNTAQVTHETYGNPYYVDFFYRGLLADLAVTNYARQVLHDWLLVKVLDPLRRPATFLNAALAFLSKPAISQYNGKLEANLLAQVKGLLEQLPAGPKRAGLVTAVDVFTKHLKMQTQKL